MPINLGSNSITKINLGDTDIQWVHLGDKMVWRKPLTFMSWTFQGNARMWDAIRDYGFKMDQLGIFNFVVDITGTITVTTIPVEITNRRVKWPHIKWFLTVRNDGTASVFLALINNTNGAQDTFISELTRILDLYPWCAGIDLDLERGGEIANMAASKVLFTRVATLVHAREVSNLLHADLPAMSSFNGSIGGENWCDYEYMNTVLDSATIMSYGFSWAGSAPGPTTPLWWAEDVYNYAITVIDSNKLIMGLPAYGWRWYIDHAPAPGGYRGTSQTYYAALYWLQGLYNHTGDAPPQPFIPFPRLWEPVNATPWALLHVYNYLLGWDHEESSSEMAPLVDESYGSPAKEYVVCYAPTQEVTIASGSVEVGNPPTDMSETGVIENGSYIAITGSEGWAEYDFNMSSGGVYDIGVVLIFPWFGKSSLDITINGNTTTLSAPAIWYPLYRYQHTIVIPDVTLLEGDNILIVSAGDGTIVGARFYKIDIASSITTVMTSGEATYPIQPRMLEDVNEEMVEPATAYKLTTEVLRRKPDSAQIWYEDYKDYGIPTGASLPSSYYIVNSGSWLIYCNDGDTSPRPYSWVQGSGDYKLDYSGFTEVHVRGKITLLSTGKAGIYFGDLYACFNLTTQAIELYEGAILKDDYPVALSIGVEYQIELRLRGTSCKVFSGTSSTLRISASVSTQIGTVGIRSDVTIHTTHLRIGDAWYYEPYEEFKILMPDGSGTTTFGRISRSNVTWNETWNVFCVNSDVEESSTRSESISMDYDYYHSSNLPLITGNDYTTKVIASDKNVWVSNLYLGDSDGFSIMYYVDIECIYALLRLDINNSWRLKGWGLWALGQEDTDIWTTLPKRVSNSYRYPTGFPRQLLDGLDEFAPLSKLKFDNTDTTLTLSGAEIVTVDNWLHSLCLDTTNGRAFSPAFSGGASDWQPRTIFLWIKPTAADLAMDSTYRVIATQRNPNDRGIHFATYNATLNVRGYDQIGQAAFNSSQAISPTLTANVWQLISLEYHYTAGSPALWKYSVFVNGVVKINNQSFTIQTNVRTEINQFEFGRMNNLYPYHGKIGGMFMVKASWLATQQTAFYTHAFDELIL